MSKTETAPKPTRRVADPELQTMAAMDRLMVTLPDPVAQGRVMCWLISRHVPGAQFVAQLPSEEKPPRANS